MAPGVEQLIPTGAEPTRRETTIDRDALAADLAREVAGSVRFDRMARLLYATDASNYRIEPLGVLCPRDADDIAAAVSVCAAHNAPVVPRAGGSGLAGQAIGTGVVLDVSPHLRAIEIDAESRTARVGAGVVLDALNARAAAHGLSFGPDPASSDRACMGGILGNNAAGARSIVHGTTVDHVLSAEVVLCDGSRAHLEPVAAGTPARDGRVGRLLADLAALGADARADVERDFPAYWRRSGGYHLDRLVSRRVDDGVVDPVAPLAGAEGTLAVVSEMRVGLVPLPAARALLVLQFDEMAAAFAAVPTLLTTRPSAVELVDRVLLSLARDAPAYARAAGFVDGLPDAVLVVEYAGASESEAASGLDRGEAALRAAGIRATASRATSAADRDRVWQVRKAGLGLLLRMRGDWKPVAGIEDTAVPPEHLAEYMAEVSALLRDLGVEAAFYAHASAGCIHVRPILNLKTAGGVAMLEALVEETFQLVRRFEGIPSSEHGDGLARGHLNPRLFGPAVYRWMERLKDAFDPLGILNPGKVVGCPPMTESLRYGPAYRGVSLPSRFAYPLDGDITRAIEQCNGAGVCRRTDGGTMCPSYRVTLDETHTTRARANALRAVVSGDLPPSALASDELAEVMGLCVGCKACATECPSGVDVARLKIEVTAARHAARGPRARDRLLADLHPWAARLSPVAPLLNPLAAAGWPLAARLLGLSPRRRPPVLRRDTLDRWWRRRPDLPPGKSREPVVLFADTFATYFEPEIGRSCVTVLEAAGHHVILPPHVCCGRPALSRGLVDRAVRDMRTNAARLAPLARAGLTIVVPEPSCASALRDEMPDLLSEPAEHADAVVVASAVRTFDEFVAELPRDALALDPCECEVLLHVHCHQRAASGVDPSLGCLDRVPRLAVTEPDAGCCGMAGAFGYEAEHLDVSLAMAELRLAPAVRAMPAGARLVAAGASCRQQIRDTTGRVAVHPAVLLAGRIQASARTEHHTNQRSEAR